MANPDHLEILRRGVGAWNQWRKENLGLTANLPEADLFGANLVLAKLREANLTGADLSWANLVGARLRGAYLYCADLTEADLRGADLTEADLFGANLRGSNLREANLTGADLVGANLSGAGLFGADLTGADLRGAMMSRVYLHGADLTRADLVGANLSGADLTETSLVGANLSRAYLTKASLTGANLTGANLIGADLRQANLVGTNFENAILKGCSVFGISAWKLNLKGAIQADLVISDFNEPIVTVDNLEVAQFIYLLLNNERVRDIINTITTKVVLILGRFTRERKAVLDAIREELRRQNYIPVLFDFDKPASRDLTETVRTLAHLARFVIADITDPRSIPQELQAIVPDLAVPVQGIIQANQEPWGMFQDFPKKYHWVLAVHRYRDLDDLLASLRDKVIGPAEAKAKELQGR